LHEKSGHMISAPPSIDHRSTEQNHIPQALKDECRRVVEGIYGNELPDINFHDHFRICWDGFTPDQEFIISAHPNCQNLYLATGGSFHGWKFLPIIGQYVVQLLDGTLEDDTVKRWAWNRPQNDGAHERACPRRDLKDLRSHAEDEFLARMRELNENPPPANEGPQIPSNLIGIWPNLPSQIVDQESTGT